MLLRGKKVEQDIVLRAHTHLLPRRIHTGKHVNAEQAGVSLGGLDQASQHRYSCRLTSTVMTEQAEDLVRVHLDIDAIDGFEAVTILFLQVGHFQKVLLDLFGVVVRAQLLVTLSVSHQRSLKVEGLVCRLEGSSIRSGLVDIPALFLQTTAPVVTAEAEAETTATTKCFRQDLIEVVSEECDPQAVDAHHDKTVSNSEVFILTPNVVTIGAHLTALEIGEHAGCLL